MLKSLLVGAGMALLAAAPAFASCTNISSAIVALTGCVDEQWQAQTPRETVEFAYLTADQNFALQIVAEAVVIPAATMRTAILSNAAEAVGSKPENVTVISEHVENIAGRPFNVIEYELTDGTQTLTYQNYYYSQPGFGTVQLLALSVPAEATTAGFKLGAFAATVAIGK